MPTRRLVYLQCEPLHALVSECLFSFSFWEAVSQKVKIVLGRENNGEGRQAGL